MQTVKDMDEAVRKAQEGDQDAFRLIVECSEARVRLIIASMLPREVDIEGVAQEVFVAAYLHLREYQPGTDFQAWLNTIARNYARNQLRKWSRDKVKTDRYRAQMEEVLGKRLAGLVSGLNDRTLDRIHACMARLTPIARSIVWAHHVEGVPGREIAATHSKSEGWIRIVLHRARQTLALCIRGQEEVRDVSE